MKRVRYVLARDLKQNPPVLSELPFLKRKQYEDEGECRLLYEKRVKTVSSKSFKLDLKAIDKITLIPWVPSAVFGTLKSVIRVEANDSSLNVTRTGVIDYPEWKNAVKALT